jgi:hypothetical protein
MKSEKWMCDELAKLKKEINSDMSDTTWYSFNSAISLLERILAPEPEYCSECGQQVKPYNYVDNGSPTLTKSFGPKKTKGGKSKGTDGVH